MAGPIAPVRSAHVSLSRGRAQALFARPNPSHRSVPTNEGLENTQALNAAGFGSVGVPLATQAEQQRSTLQPLAMDPPFSKLQEDQLADVSDSMFAQC